MLFGAGEQGRFTATMPQCDDAPPPDEQLDAAVAAALGQVKNPWGDADDFFRVMLLTQAKLGCAIVEKDVRDRFHVH